jgi:hypothetical protein
LRQAPNVRSRSGELADQASDSAPAAASSTPLEVQAAFDGVADGGAALGLQRPQGVVDGLAVGGWRGDELGGGREADQPDPVGLGSRSTNRPAASTAASRREGGDVGGV